MNDFATILLSIDARGVARLVLNRPDKHNALNAQMIAELRAALEQIENNSSIRVVILSSEGKTFCAGADLAWMKEQDASGRAGRMAQATELACMLKELNDLNKPVIVRVQGQAYGGGIGLMAVSDIIIAQEDARFALTETRLGLIPAIIAPFLIARMGEGVMRHVALNACPFDGREAARLGLASEAVSGEQLDVTVQKHIDLFLQCAPGAVADAKAWIRELADHRVEDNEAAAVQRLADRWEGEEAKEGLKGFFAGTKPSWQDD